LGWKPDTRVAGHSAAWLAAAANATACQQVLGAAGAGQTPTGVPPLVDARQLDGPPTALRGAILLDPRELHERDSERKLEIEFIIDAQGRVIAPRVRGVVDPRLAWSALHTLPQWEYRPPLRDGVAVATRVVQEISFPAAPAPIVSWDFVDIAPVPLTRWLGNVSPYGKESGETRLVCVVDPEGHAADVRVLGAPDAEHARSASLALPDWAFSPGLLNGKAVETRMEIMAPVKY
ncbi:MAG TPA: energy transducer TonB, partial [Opitutaceae bacterium]|nr:energy transducer TonB [Opitutaceae bacterium]